MLRECHCKEYPILLLGLCTGHEPGPRIGPGRLKFSRVESGRVGSGRVSSRDIRNLTGRVESVQEMFEISRVGSGPVGSGSFQVSRVESGHPDQIQQASGDPTHEKPCLLPCSLSKRSASPIGPKKVVAHSATAPQETSHTSDSGYVSPYPKRGFIL